MVIYISSRIRSANLNTLPMMTNKQTSLYKLRADISRRNILEVQKAKPRLS